MPKRASTKIGRDFFIVAHSDDRGKSFGYPADPIDAAKNLVELSKDKRRR